MLILAFLIFRSYKQKKKDNILLTEQKQQIETQRDEITDSIKYAKRIQTAILPPGDYINSIMPPRFILFKPKDIVSGDFYWVTEKNGKIIAVAADCTGHGVPGAFMSMLGVTFLNDIVKKEGIVRANEILDNLKGFVIKSLRQTGKEGESKDGMDIALCVLDKKANTIEYSGANNPLYIISDKPVENGDTILESGKFVLTEFKPDKMPIGIHYSEKNMEFTNHVIQLQKGDSIYLFSDGFPDQFGGEKGKKFKYKPFKQLLLDNCCKSMEEQKVILEETFSNWKGDFEQIDDVLVIGMKI